MTKLRKAFGFLTVAGAALYALPLMASGSQEAKSGLPQLDMSYVPAQLFWLAVTFAILYVLMAKLALPGVRRVQDHRLETISAELAAAAAANDEAKATMQRYETALADARANAQATVNEIKVAAAKTSADQQAAQEKQMSQRLHEAEAKIAQARDGAIREASEAAPELAKLIVERVLGTKSQAAA